MGRGGYGGAGGPGGPGGYGGGAPGGGGRQIYVSNVRILQSLRNQIEMY